MPTGTGAAVLRTLPDVPYSIEPATFFELTEKNIQPLDQVPAPGPGGSTTFYLPKSGVASLLRLKFQGTLTVVTAASGDTQPVPSSRWPYGLLSKFTLSAGLGSDVWDVDGLDLDALWHADNPHSEHAADSYPGALGGGGSALASGSYDLELSWTVPIAVDQQSLVASLFAQSSSSNIACKIGQETISNLVESGGTSSLWTITGNFIPVETLWEIPVNGKGELILPDVTSVHIGASLNQALTGTGRQPAAVQRTSGLLQRLFLRAETSPTSFLSALATSPADTKIDQIQINYGLTQTPLIFAPASVLAEINAENYGTVLPYDTYVWDTLAENPNRDAIFLAGITELQALVYPDPSVSIVAGAHTHLLEEILA